MTDLNAIHVTGRLTRDTELRSTSMGNRFAWFSLAINGGKDKAGNSITDFVMCQLWGKPAELLEKFGKKGMRIMITRGLLKSFVREDPKTGEKQNRVYILVNSYEFLDSLKQAKEQSSFLDMGESLDVDF